MSDDTSKSASAHVQVRHIRLPLLGKMLVLLLYVAVLPLIIVGTVSIRRGVDAVGRTAEQNLQVIASTAGAPPAGREFVQVTATSGGRCHVRNGG